MAINTSSYSKKESIEKMFDDIAPRYDFLNHFLSFGIDKRWRKRLRKEMAKQIPQNILDVATGTGGLAFEIAKLAPESITGVDISEKMLKIAEKKARNKNLEDKITFLKADGTSIPFQDSSFDAVSIAFGIRNFEDPGKGLKEMHRVIKTGGKLYVLEFGMPEKQPVKTIYKFYFLKVLPFIGRLFSGNFKAYKYLPDSVGSFAYGKSFEIMLSSWGFKNIKYIKLSKGISYLYIGEKHS